jgi:hypothetical protein
MTQGRRPQGYMCWLSRQTPMKFIRVEKECETRGDRHARAGQTFHRERAAISPPNSVDPTLWFRATQVVLQASYCAVFALLSPID